jgi:hypothetical protein
MKVSLNFDLNLVLDIYPKQFFASLKLQNNEIAIFEFTEYTVYPDIVLFKNGDKEDNVKHADVRVWDGNKQIGIDVNDFNEVA